MATVHVLLDVATNRLVHSYQCPRGHNVSIFTD